MTNKQLELFLFDERILFETNVDLKKRTWIHRGGVADYFILPDNSSSLEKVMAFLFQNKLPYQIIGCTSNLYFLNTTNVPIVVSTLKCNHFELKNGYIECECGVLVSGLSKRMVDQSIKGFEYLTKLPGTIGAAIYNNSSCKKNSISDLLVDVDIITPYGIQKYQANDLHFEFRTSDLKKHFLKGVVLRARLSVEYSDKEALQKIAFNNEIERKRILEGPAQNLGCTVNRMFSNGVMPVKYRIPYKIISKLFDLIIKDKDKKKKWNKNVLLTISGYRKLIPYVSDKQLITFIWRDECADKYFEEYLEFMRDVCKTDQVEIEIIR